MNIKRSVGIFVVLSMMVATIPVAAATDGLVISHTAGGQKHFLTQEELAALDKMTDAEKEAYVLAQVKEQLDSQVAAGALTQEQADEIYEHCASGEFRKTENGQQTGKPNHMNGHMGVSGKAGSMLSEDELSAFDNMTDDEKKVFMLSKMKDRLDTDVSEGLLTQEQADNIYEQMSAMDISFSHDGRSMSFGVKAKFNMPGFALTQEELLSFDNMTDDEKHAFMLEQLKAHLDADVENGHLTQEEADEIYAHSESGGFKIGFLMPTMPMEPVEN
ncbi:hypothetical protein MsAg5_17430 [Methanosarcinaceae archaeon Ag5]|uniref:DUF2680 domain-containing protein n=1 Tax=Methanolapillus africanus TaxID=3028297 RepID=A0AAE4MKW4_9EURY|nr:hypothetical protein [Methanosarcinaceae archaeon Ag5]